MCAIIKKKNNKNKVNNCDRKCKAENHSFNNNNQNYEMLSTILYQTAIPIFVDFGFIISLFIYLYLVIYAKRRSYLLHTSSLLAPRTSFPFALHIVIGPSFAHNPSRCMEWEIQTELGQLQIVQAICLTWYSALWSIDENLNRDDKQNFN